MTPPDDRPTPYGVELEELLGLERKIEIAPGLTQYNTNQNREAIRILRRAARAGDRVEIAGWDSDSGLLFPFVTNFGHASGESASYFLEQMGKSDSKTLSDELIRTSPFEIIGRAHIDFFQINVYEKEK